MLKKQVWTTLQVIQMHFTAIATSTIELHPGFNLIKMLGSSLGTKEKLTKKATPWKI